MNSFEKEYFINSNVSNYNDYREKKFDSLAGDIFVIVGEDRKLLDFGSATGGLIHSLKKYNLKRLVGTDLSFWAIKFGRENYGLTPEELQHYNRSLLEEEFDFITMLDVLEHIPTDEIDNILCLVKANNIIVRIPVSIKDGEDFFLQVSRNDTTHIQIHDKNWWENKFLEHGFVTKDVLSFGSIYESDGVLSRVFTR